MSPEAYLVIGVVFALLFFELTDVSPGGLLVPGYVALLLELGRSDRLILCLGIAFVTVFLMRGLARYLILFGRRRFAVFILTGFTLRVTVETLMPGLYPALSGLEAIGWLIPGIIASDLDRQGALRTLPALAAVAAMVKLITMTFPGDA